MKSIQLHTAKPTNGGSFRDAGAIVDIGDKAEQIDAKTAKALVGDGLAAAPKPEAAEAKDAGSK